MRPVREWAAIRWAHAHVIVMDGLLAAVMVAITLSIHLFDPEHPDYTFRNPTWWTAIIVVAASAPLIWRRIYPIPAALAAVGIQIGIELFDINGTGWVPAVLVLYALGSHAQGRPRLRALVAIAVAVEVLLGIGITVEEVSVGDAIGLTTSLGVAYLVGDRFQRRRNEFADLAERADRAERERELMVARRVAEERTRIARELHDVIAHSVSVMVIQAGGARLNIERDPTAAVRLLANVEDTGRAAMQELRQVLGVLRDAGEDRTVSPLPRLVDLGTFVETVADIDVALTTTGSLDDLPTGTELSAYRVVQEALTNVRRHAGPIVRVSVEVARHADRLDVSIDDDGRGASATVSTPPGYGLVGMRERVTAVGGTLDTGPRRDGGWSVRAHFPLVSVPGVKRDVAVAPTPAVGAP
ncbi:histidine kinase [soil metagenome]